MNETSKSQKRNDHFIQMQEIPSENAIKTLDWQPYQNSHLEQPILFHCSCCGPSYYKFRWNCLKCIQNTYIFSNYSIGFCFVFLVFLIISVVFVYYTWENKLLSALLPSFFLQLVFLFPLRNSIWLYLTGISYENFLYWHKYAAVLTILTGAFHGLIGFRNLSGILLISIMTLMLLFSLHPFRTKYFEFFFKSHWILFILAVFISIIHGVKLIAILFWLIDVSIRFYLIRKNKHLQENLEIIEISPTVLKLIFNKPENFNFKPGQFFFICFPLISVFEWHPFSMSSAPNENKITIYIKVLGDWTRSLYEKSKLNSNMNIWLDGPYGNCGLNLDGDDEYQIFLLISGGVGINPVNSLYNSLIFEQENGRNVKKVLSIWSGRDNNLLEDIKEDNEKNIKIIEKYGVFENFYHLSNSDEVNNLKNKGEIIMGRPNLNDYFMKAKNYAVELEMHKIATVCCGPERMLNEVTELAKKWSVDGVKFDFHQEVFEL